MFPGDRFTNPAKRNKKRPPRRGSLSLLEKLLLEVLADQFAQIITSSVETTHHS